MEQPNCDSVRQEDEKAAEDVEQGPPEEGDCNIIRMVANKFFGCFIDANSTLQKVSHTDEGLNKAEI